MMKNRFFPFKYEDEYFLYDSDIGIISEINKAINDAINDNIIVFNNDILERDSILGSLKSYLPIKNIDNSYKSLYDYINQFPDVDDKSKIIRTNRSVSKEQWYEGEVLNKLWLSIAHSCNMNCRYCFAEAGIYGHRSMMSINTARKSIDYFFKYVNRNAKHIDINFFGGEPMLNKQCFIYCIDYINEKAKSFNFKVKYILTTNGTLLDSEIVEKIIENNMTVNLSIDGGEKIHNANRKFIDGKPSYNLVEENSRKLLSKSKNVIARVTLTKPGVDSFKEDILKLWEIGFEEIYVDKVDTPIEELTLDKDSIDRFKVQLEEVYKIMEDNILKGQPKFISNIVSQEYSIYKKIVKAECKYFNPFTIKVTPEGDIYKCSFTFGDKKHCVGNIEKGIDWNLFNKNFVVEKKCLDCWAKRICGGGCPLKVKDNSYCNYTKTIAEISLKFNIFLLKNNKDIMCFKNR